MIVVIEKKLPIIFIRLISEFFIHCKIILFIICLAYSYEVNAQIFNVTDTPYNAKGNGKDDDRLPILNAIIAANKWSIQHSNSPVTVYFPSNSYSPNCYLIKSLPASNRLCSRLRNYLFPVYSNMIFMGDSTGNGTSTLKFGNNLFNDLDSTTTDSVNGTGIYANFNMFYGQTINGIYVTNVGFDNLTIDFNGINNLIPSGQGDAVHNNCNGRLKTIYGIIMDGGNNVSINRVTMLNNPGQNDIVVNAPGKNLAVTNCTFKNGGRNIGSDKIQNTNHIDFSFVYSEWNNSTFTNNSIVQEYPEITLQKNSFSGGIEIHGSNSIMSNNYIFGCKPAVFVGSGNSLSQDFSIDNKPMENIQIRNNRIIDCFGGITLLTKNDLNNVIIDSNTIITMFLKKTTLFDQVYDDNFKEVGGIVYTGGDMPCPSNYDFKGSYWRANGNLKPITNMTISNNDFRFDSNSISPGYLLTTGMLLHSLHNSTITKNSVKNMNWSGISLQGSRWGMDKVAIRGNEISGFTYCNNPSAVSGFIVVTDYYKPNNNCSPTHRQTFTGIDIMENTFISNKADTYENLHCYDMNKRYACFKGLYFDLPSWYAYTSYEQPYGGLQNAAFLISSNNIFTNANESKYYASSICSNSDPCLPL